MSERTEDSLAEATDDGGNVHEIRQGQNDAPATPSPSSSSSPTSTNEGTSKATLFLAALLVASLAYNFFQSQSRASLETQSAEYATALERTVERLDQEVLRANDAEATIDAIDASIGTVNTRILDLQSALGDLTDITARSAARRKAKAAPVVDADMTEGADTSATEAEAEAAPETAIEAEAKAEAAPSSSITLDNSDLDITL